MRVLQNSGFNKFSQNKQTNTASQQSVSYRNHSEAPPTFIMPGVYKYMHTFVFAGAVSDRINKAFRPIRELVLALGEPIAFLMIAGSMILIMLGQKRKGVKMVKWAALGYIGLHFTPVIFDLLRDVARAMLE